MSSSYFSVVSFGLGIGVQQIFSYAWESGSGTNRPSARRRDTVGPREPVSVLQAYEICIQKLPSKETHERKGDRQLAIASSFLSWDSKAIV